MRGACGTGWPDACLVSCRVGRWLPVLLPFIAAARALFCLRRAVYDMCVSRRILLESDAVDSAEASELLAAIAAAAALPVPQLLT